MRRGLIERGIAGELRERIEKCKENKTQLLTYVNQLKDKALAREITYSEYEEALGKKLKGKTIQEWLEFYDSYIKLCEDKIREERKNSIIRETLLIFLSFSLIFVVAISLSYLRPAIIGLIVQEKPQTFTQTINLEFNQSEVYEWNPENMGLLNSVKISGLIEGEGQVKVYLDDLLILNSDNLKSKGGITGLTIGETPQESPPAEGQSSSSGIQEAQKEETPSQEPPVSEAPSAEIPATEIPATEENVTQPAENITPTAPENITQPEENITITQFTAICEETCNLSKLNLTKSSYKLRIEITNAKLNLKTIEYEVISAIPANITNITIPENVTNVTIANITNFTINTTQYKAVIGQPVKWKKSIQLENPGTVKINLPKEAENITVNKIIEKTKQKESYSETQGAQKEETPSQEPPVSENITQPPENITPSPGENITKPENITNITQPENITEK